MRFFRFPTAMVRPLRSLATFLFVISNMPFLSEERRASFSCEHSCNCEYRLTFARWETAYTGRSSLQVYRGCFFRLPDGRFRAADNSLGHKPENPLVAVVWARSESLSRNGTLAEFCGGGAVGRPALPRPGPPTRFPEPPYPRRPSPTRPSKAAQALLPDRGHTGRHPTWAPPQQRAKGIGFRPMIPSPMEKDYWRARTIAEAE